MQSNRHSLSGFVAGLFVAAAVACMLGTRPQDANAAPRPPRINPQVEALMKQIKECEDRLADAQAQLNFWQTEAVSQANEVTRLQNDATNPTAAFFLSQAQGMSCRAVNSALDARLNVTLCTRKVQALKAELSGP
jgi:hypothetical protein